MSNKVKKKKVKRILVWKEQLEDDTRVYDDLEWNVSDYTQGVSNCERCNTRITERYGVEEESVGLRTIGIDCYSSLTNTDNQLVSTIVRHKNADYLKKDFEKWVNKLGQPVREYKFRHNKLRMVRVNKGKSSGWIMTIGFKVVGKKYYEWSKESRALPKNLSSNQYKSLLFLYYTFLDSKNDKVKDFTKMMSKKILNDR